MNTNIYKEAVYNNSKDLEWKLGKDESNIIINNEKIGVKIVRYNIINNNKILYDTIAINESRCNAVIVLVDENENIGLIFEWRPIPQKWFWACIRGFYEKGEVNQIAAAKRELFEEVGIKTINHINNLGEYYQNTTYFENPTNVIEIKVQIKDKIQLQKEEGIYKLSFFTKKEIITMVNENKIICQHTLAALMKYFSQNQQNII